MSNRSKRKSRGGSNANAGTPGSSGGGGGSGSISGGMCWNRVIGFMCNRMDRNMPVFGTLPFGVEGVSRFRHCRRNAAAIHGCSRGKLVCIGRWCRNTYTAHASNSPISTSILELRMDAHMSSSNGPCGCSSLLLIGQATLLTFLVSLLYVFRCSHAIGIPRPIASVAVSESLANLLDALIVVKDKPRAAETSAPLPPYLSLQEAARWVKTVNVLYNFLSDCTFFGRRVLLAVVAILAR
mmetsp:Transcript_28896/g.63640  ORF Transcript_28896/g.63640 Transcript_28896/m.63640 type:complete len:239 (+) Transcript_28896:43-759(+)